MPIHRRLTILALVLLVSAPVLLAGASQSQAGVPPRVISLWGGARHGIALMSDGTVWDWGLNAFGKLGDGTQTDRHLPIQVHGPGDVGYLSSIVAVMGGETHNLALKSDGTVWAWGWNNFGQLGDGTYTSRYTPVQVSGLTSATALGGRGYHSLAIRSGGTVWAWGWNSYGQLGVSTTITRSATPVQVLGLSGVLTVTGGYNFSLALLSDHTLRAWGCNTSGQLGDGTNTSASAPVAVKGLTNVTQVSAGWKHVVALKGDGTVWAWGQNAEGEVGNGLTSTIGISVPLQVAGLDHVVAVSGGDCHTTALKDDGTVWAWGCNNGDKGVGNFELGDGTNIERHTPVQVVGLTNVVAMTARDYHNYALKADGTVWAWGFNYNGQLGNGTTDDSNQPVQVLFVGAPFTPATWVYVPFVTH